MSGKIRRVLFDAHPLIGKKTGVGYYTDLLVRELAKQHPETEFVGYYHNFLYRKKIPPLPVASNIRYRRVAFMPGQIVNLLRRFHILLPIELLTFTRANFILYPNFFGLSSLFRTPSASVIHDLTFVDLPEYVAPKNLSDLTRFIPAQIRRSSFIITVSEFSKQRINEAFGVPLSDIVVTPIPPETPELRDAGAERSILEKLGIASKYILTLGTIEPRKNVPNMIEAYSQLPQEIQQEYTFVIAGGIGWNCKWEVALLEQVKQESRNILHTGYVTHEERSALYQGAALFTWATFYEGFGMPVLEAMSYGLPCALSDIPVLKEAAADSALYFDQTKPASIAKAWQRLLTDASLREHLADAGKKRVAKYRWDEVANSLYARIAAAVGGNKS
jgi:alpha-1,3-rhamnosyl/mannosyltransferase